MEKLERGGKVAVLVSPGFGAGWSSWADDDQRDALLMDKELCTLVDAGNIDGAVTLAKSMFPHFYEGGREGLEVKWLDKGTVFEVEEYDDSERLHIIGSRSYHVA